MELSIQTNGLMPPLDPDTGYRLLKEYGFSCVDWNMNKAWLASAFDPSSGSCGSVFERPLEEILAYYGDHLSAQKKYGIRPAQMHAPYPSYRLDCPAFDDYVTAMYSRMIEFCHEVGIPYLVIHGISRLFSVKMSAERAEEMNWRLYSSLIPALQKTDVTVCLENLFTRDPGGGIYVGAHSDPVAAAETIDRLNALAGKECFGFCLDTGHLNLLRLDFRSFIPALGSRIKCLHLNDNDQCEDRHRVPYNGNAPWENFYEEMQKIGYRGTVNFETREQYPASRIPDPAFLEPWLAYLSAVGTRMGRRMGLKNE